MVWSECWWCMVEARRSSPCTSDWTTPCSRTSHRIVFLFIRLQWTLSTAVKIRGVFVHGGFKSDNHVDFVLSVCSQRVYLLKLLRDRGLQLPQLHTVCQSLIVSRILYALPAWVDYYQLNSWKDESMRSCDACRPTNVGLCSQPLTLNLCWLQAITDCLEICKSVNTVLIIYSLHARTRTILLHFDPLVTSLYSLLAIIISCIGAPLLYAVFLTF